MEGVSEVNTGNWRQEVSQSTMIDRSMLTVVYFWHKQCLWCLRLNPIFNEITEEYRRKIKFVKLNVLENPANQEIASKIDRVMSTPTLLLLCSGRPVGQIDHTNVIYD